MIERDLPAFSSSPMTLLGRFSGVQTTSTDLVRSYAQRAAPGLMSLLEDRVLRAVRDEDRVPTIRRIAEACSVDADLDNLGQTFNDVKRLRDLMAHSLDSGEMWSAQLLRPVIALTYDSQQRKNVERTGPLTTAKMGQALVDCEWMEAQVEYVWWKADINDWITMDGEPVELEKPVAVPPRWNARTNPFQDQARLDEWVERGARMAGLTGDPHGRPVNVPGV